MIKKNLIPIVAFALAGLIVLFIYLSQKGTVSVNISANSAIKDGVEISFSFDKYKKSYPAPGDISLRPGTHKYVAFAPGSALTSGEIIVANGETASLSISLAKNPDANLPGSNPDNLSGIEDFSFFPYIAGDYRLDAILNSQQSSIDYLQLTVYHRFSTNLNQQENDLSLSAAKKWLKDQGLENKYQIKLVDGN